MAVYDRRGQQWSTLTERRYRVAVLASAHGRIFISVALSATATGTVAQRLWSVAAELLLFGVGVVDEVVDEIALGFFLRMGLLPILILHSRYGHHPPVVGVGIALR